MTAPHTLRLAAVLCAPIALGAACGAETDRLACATAGCEFSRDEWDEIASLAELPTRPPDDPSNKYVGSRAAEALGQKFFYDARFSGPSTQVDALRRPVAYARSPRGQPSNLSCASCHDYRRAGVDTTSAPGHVSIGAGWSDTNALPTFNAAYYRIVYWNGRADSLWAQAVASNEGPNMNGNRLRTAWIIRDLYRDDYAAAFPDHPLPLAGSSRDLQMIVEAEGPRAGQCRLSPGCPAGCREVTESSATSCWPRFPLQGKPGAKPGCQAGDPGEPFGDAFDCMDKGDQETVTRVLVNWAKAIAAYEFRLVSRGAAFDDFVAELRTGRESRAIPAAARHGARLFVRKAACVECHRGPLLSDSLFHNVGVPQVGSGVPTEADCPEGGFCDCVESPEGAGDGARNCLPWGARDGLAKLRTSSFRRDSRWSDDPSDASRRRYMEVSLPQVPKGGWRTPTLRDVAVTAPYMHNGLFATLEDVIWHYNVGGSPAAPGSRSPRIKPLYLSTDEQESLVAFLKTLTGRPLAPELIAPPVLP